MLSHETILELMRSPQSNADRLRELAHGEPFEATIEAFYQARKKLQQDQVFDLWHVGRQRFDQLAGLLCLSELRMPHLEVFGKFELTHGDKLTKYDLARQFLLKELNGKGPIRDFYPEVRRQSLRERVLTLASSHVGCSPKSIRQINLFSLCCIRTLGDASKSTTPSPGTTCGFFMRAILKAAGNSWLTPTKLPTMCNMMWAMGVESDKVAAYNNVTAPRVGQPWPLRGDMYFVIRPSVAAPLPGTAKKQDSGHVGFVGDYAMQDGNRLKFMSIDGGTERSGGDGFHTICQHQTFEKGARGFFHQLNKRPKDGENRILAGFVNLDRIASDFTRDWSLSLDGRELDMIY